LEKLNFVKESSQRISTISENSLENIAGPHELRDLLQMRCPDFFTIQQKTRYKEVAAQIIFEKLNEDSNYGCFNPRKREKTLVILLFFAVFCCFLLFFAVFCCFLLFFAFICFFLLFFAFFAFFRIFSHIFTTYFHNIFSFIISLVCLLPPEPFRAS